MKTLPIPESELLALAERIPTPFHVYDEATFLAAASRLQKAFSWHPRFTEFFAVKAAPNPYILKSLHGIGCGADCSSLPELVLSERAGLRGEEIIFTSNDTPTEEFVKAAELGAIINLDDISHIDFLKRALGGKLPELVCFRFNPGPLKDGNEIIGKPEEAKYGFTREQLSEGFRILRENGVKRFGLHTMVVSNELDPEYFIDTAVMLFRVASEISAELGITFDLINLGGGIGIPYLPERPVANVERIGEGVRAAYEASASAFNERTRLCLECGRYITGPAGVLVAKVRHIKRTYRNYAGLDACMANLMRPALYGAYHHITALGKAADAPREIYDVTGSLCENNDKFAIARELPRLQPGDLLAIHDAGAHGHAMGFQYNGKLRSAEYLRRTDGSCELIRRAETLDDYFATLDWQAL